MRIAIVSDIHGNLISLQAVLRELEHEPVDRVLFLGDAAAFGPQPKEALALLKSLPRLDCVLGNTDELLLEPPSMDEAKDDRERVIVRRLEWGRQFLDDADRSTLRSFKPTVSLPLDGGISLLGYHGSPSSNRENLFPTTEPEAFDRALMGQKAGLLVGGHTHIQMFRRHADRIFLNPGSVGMPNVRVGSRTYRPPWAEYARVTCVGDHLDVSLRRVPVDVGKVIHELRISGLPAAEEFIHEWQAA